MDPVGLAFGALSTTDLCLKYGRILVAKYKIYKEAETEIGEAILRIQHHWMMIEMELEVLRDISHLLEGKLQLHLNTLYQVLQVKLQEATVTLDSVIGKREEGDSKTGVFSNLVRKEGEVNRIKLAVRVKKTLDATLAELEKWHRMLEPSWFLLALIQNPAIDRHLTDQRASKSESVSTLKGLRDAIKSNSGTEKSASVFILEPRLLDERRPIPYSPGEVGQEQQTGDHLLIDSLIPDSFVNVTALTKNVRDLARVLSAVEPMKFGILACRGVVKTHNSAGEIERFQFVFGIPDPLHTPRSLRDLLVTSGGGGGCPYPLEERYQFAKQLARSVMFVHTADFVHKNIRPETIIVFQDGSSALGVPFLVGFSKFRAADGNTYLTGDLEWEKNLYRHPLRQGLSPEELYRMQHDIYSLGVCLLEVGLWDSFVLLDATTGGFIPAQSLNISEHLAMKRQKEKAYKIKGELFDMAKRQLPSKMGLRYTEVVVSCLSCLDGGQGNNDFGDQNEFLDEDGILVGVRYIEKILVNLDKIMV